MKQRKVKSILKIETYKEDNSILDVSNNSFPEPKNSLVDKISNSKQGKFKV